MGEIEVEGPTARELLQRVLSNDVDRIAAGEAQYTLLTNERRRDRRRPDRLPPRRAATCSSSTRRTATPTSRWLKERELRGSDVRDVSDDYALLAVQGPRALERLGLAHGAGVHLGDGRDRRRRGDGQPHRLHRRGGRRARLHGRRRAARSGTRCSRGRRCRAGSARATRCGSRSATRSTATTSGRSGTRSRPGSAGRARSTTEFTGVERAARGQGGAGPSAARRVPDDREGDPAPGHADRGRRRGDVRVACRRCSTSASASATCRPRWRRREPN